MEIHFVLIGLLVLALLVFVVSNKSMEVNGQVNEEEINEDDYETAVFAGGCFWCIEGVFESLDGVKGVISGYTGGHKENPTYGDVSTGETGHYEANKIIYDSSVVSYSELLDFYWKQIDPLDSEGQFVDKGSQYRTAIFYSNDEEKRIAEESRAKVAEELGAEVFTEILPLGKFYEAEEYHQDYYKKRVLQYKVYEAGSGRKERLGELWDE